MAANSPNRSLVRNTFPDYSGAPAHLKQRHTVSPVATDVALELPLPVRSVGRRRRGARAAVVAMPEATVHETNRPESREDEVRSAGKRGVVELVPQAAGVQRATQDQLRSGIPTLNSRHDARPSRAVEGVRHTLLGLEAEPRMILGKHGGYRIAASRAESRLGSCIVVGASTTSGLLRIRPASRSRYGLVRDLARKV